MNNWSDRKKAIAIIAGLIAIVAVIILIVSTASKNDNPYGEQVTIKNYNVKNLPDDRRDSIFAALYNVIDLNKAEGSEKPDINDAIVRKDSEEQSYDSDNDIYTGNLIVDVKSIKQSYYIQYSYSANPDNAEVGGYPVTATCLPVDKLIYGDFKCKDALQQESAGVDPITQYLPQSTLSYQIEASTDADNKTVLNIRLLLSEADYRIGEAEAVSTYTQEALNWITSKGLNPNDYTINYSH